MVAFHLGGWHRKTEGSIAEHYCKAFGITSFEYGRLLMNDPAALWEKHVDAVFRMLDMATEEDKTAAWARLVAEAKAGGMTFDEVA
jgi:hypothetical protein